ncbi:MAG TPA: AAA family ATPase [Actinoplanes sp.]|nr:AAA family ATPase [Actinoplanes sp.]
MGVPDDLGRSAVGEGSGGRAVILHEGPRNRVSRLPVAGRTVICKEALRSDAAGRVRHEMAMLHRLKGLAGIAQLADGIPGPPGSLLLADVGGVNLAQVAKPIAIEDLVACSVALARATAGMHARGVMHRNICPANIVIGRDGTPCLVGFGLARAVAEVRPEFIPAGEIVGELAYLAPEQTGRTGRSVDERADLYALGATLYELATGAPPFGWGDPLRLLRDHLARVPAAPLALNPAVPEPLSQIIMHLLEKEADHRYQTAEGLVHDLERVRDGTNAVQVGAHDVPLRLAAPSRLVGRENEVAALDAAFDDALTGRCRGVLVSGTPGVGKTMLIDQLRPAVTGRDGWYVSGKFDQYRRDLEFDAVHQAMRALGRLLLAEPEDDLVEIRARILRALGPNAGLLTAVVPELAALLEVPADPGDPLTAQTRIQWAGVQVLRAVASRKRPVLMFLDDLQWAGRPPLGIVDLILRGEPVEGLLLVAAHREVDATHPLTTLLTRWGALDGVRCLGLEDLPAAGVVAMVAEMLHLDRDAVDGLAELITAHSGGNPYETVELLNALRQAQVLAVTPGGWRWDLVRVHAHLKAAEPTRLLRTRVEALPAPSRRVVEAMACLGGRAEPGLLATATGAPADVVVEQLAPPLVDRLLVAESESDASVRFRHDRIREAVLTTLDPLRRRGLHLAMARRLAGLPLLFGVAAEQYLPVVDAVTDAVERRQVVALLRRAADQAALIGDHVLVSTMLGAAVRLIDPDRPDIEIAVRSTRHAALFSAGRLDEADEEYRTIETLTGTALERSDAATVQVLSLTHRNRYAEAIALGVATLRRLSISVPSGDRLGRDLDRQLGHLERWRERTDVTVESTRSEMTDPVLLAAAHLIHVTSPAAYFSGDLATDVWLGMEAVRIWVDHGPAPALVGAAASATFAAVALCGDQAAARLVGVLQRISAVGEARGYEPATSQARFLFGAVGWHLEPIEETARVSRQARDGLIAGGDLTYAAYAYHAQVCYLTDCAPSLDTVAAETRAGLAFAHRTGNEQAGQWLDSQQWLVRTLRGESTAAAEPIPADRYAGNPMALLNAHVARALAAAVVGDASGLDRHTAAAMPLLPTAAGLYPTACARLLRGLAAAEQARTAGGDDRDGLLAELNEIMSWLAARAVDAPSNFEHLIRLLEAERAWAVGDFRTAELAYDTALHEAGRRQRPWHQALTTEHAARFYLTRGLSHLGHELLAQARRQYAAWGAHAKVTQLHWAFPTLPPGPEPAAGHGVEPPADQPAVSSTPVTRGTIDLLGILSASQAISSETTLERLHARVGEVLAGMTGATHVRLLVRSEDERHWITPTQDDSVTALARGHEHTVPMTVLRYLNRTGEPLVVADTTADDRFARDPYFADTGCCSLLAVPIHSRGALRAVLLLENRLLRAAFTAERLDAVALIAGQLAVSLDNAGLYEELTVSRQRIVATADHTRRRIERDLHDGAQQRLVSLTMRLRAIQAAAPADLADQLEQVVSEAGAAAEELREIAHGLHPAVLTTGGLRSALRALARRATIPVQVQAAVTGRLPEAVETGAYYLIAEALTNAVKHADATVVTITVDIDPTHPVLRLIVEDDGVGGADLARGTGLLSLKDRAEALGGRLQLDSPPGAGTRLYAQIPLTTTA